MRLAVRTARLPGSDREVRAAPGHGPPVTFQISRRAFLYNSLRRLDRIHLRPKWIGSDFPVGQNLKVTSFPCWPVLPQSLRRIHARRFPMRIWSSSREEAG